MISFCNLDLADRQWLAPLFEASAYRGCDYSFVNLYLWGQQQYALVAGIPVVFSTWQGRSGYLYPGEGDLPLVLRTLAADAAARGIPLRLSGLTKERADELEALLPGRFAFTLERDRYDYLYEVQRLAQLTGKRLQQKRNHINRFSLDHPGWTTAPITPDNLSECRALVARWQDAHETDDALERQALARAFDAYERLGLEGIALYADGNMAAMAIGSRLRRDTFDVNFEKADLPGAYQVINREFARRIQETHPEVRYLNREDDMGLPGIRKSKLSYDPDILLEKYAACLRDGSL